MVSDPSVIEDVRALVARGESVQEISRLMGRKPSSLAQLMYRHGHMPEARLFWRYEGKQRRPWLMARESAR